MLAVEQRRQCEVVDAAWMEAHGLGMPKVIESESESAPD